LTGTYGPAIRAPVRRSFGAAQSPSWRAGDHQQHRLEEAGPDEIRAPGSNTGKKMFAVFKTGGKQYRVAPDDVLKVDKIMGEPGEIVAFDDVLVVGGDSVTLGAPTIAGATVAAEVLDQARGPKIIAFKKRRRKNSRRKRGHRQEFTLLRITEILTDGKKPSKTAKPKAEPASAAEVEAESAASPESVPQRKSGKPKSLAAKTENRAAKPRTKK
jgi:large subunit ribosomal protein L21